MLKILKQTREEERSMYDKLPKSMLIEMLINCNDVIEILTQEKNCVTPKEVEKDKDYEILSFKQDGLCEDLWTEFSHGWCRNSNGNPVTMPYSYNEILNNHLNGGIKYHINSVKRKSDGEIFTIGDKFMDGEISAIEVINNEMWIFHNGIKPNVKLKEAKKIKTPLFTTEDNVDIFEGDKYFQLAVSFSPNFREAIYEEIARPNIKYSYNCKEGREQLNKNGRYYFSTKEAAEEYALTVKPCLSVKDILKRFSGQKLIVNETILKELVKSKNLKL